ncbi:MAG: hypothetical protein KGL45_06915 [Gammaproteobacteria bacterium]|nr:hypothetical protein [Gammaproteobacteria bacterium]
MAALAMAEMTEARLGRLESGAAHIRSDVADMRVEVRELRKEIDDAHVREDRLEARRYETWSRIVTWLGYAMVTVALARAFNWI